MKNDNVSQGEPRKVKIDEAKVCQLVAVLEKMWPDLGASKPDLKIVAPKEAIEICDVLREVNRTARRNQLIALLDEAWGPVAGGHSKLEDDSREQGAAFKTMLRAIRPQRYSGHAHVIQFPRAKKRGAKVRKGPCADIIQFRCGRADLSENERAVFDALSKTNGVRYANAVIDYLRLPIDEGSRFHRQGMTLAEFLHRLNCGAISP